MAEQVFPTKGNLLRTKRSLQLARSGFDLLDRKRSILMREMTLLVDRADRLQQEIGSCYEQAYDALQKAHVACGLLDGMAAAVPVENGWTLSSRSVMGVEVPTLTLTPQPVRPYYGLAGTGAALDEVYLWFDRVKRLTTELAETECSVYRLATAVRQTQKRANALKNVVIPRLSATAAHITEALEEKEREDFSRLRVIKDQKEKKQEADSTP